MSRVYLWPTFQMTPFVILLTSRTMDINRRTITALFLACSCFLASVCRAETSGKWTVYRNGGGGTAPPTSLTMPVGHTYLTYIVCAGGGGGGVGSVDGTGACVNGGGGAGSGGCIQVQFFQSGPGQQFFTGLTLPSGQATGNGGNVNFDFSTGPVVGGAVSYSVSVKGGGAARDSGSFVKVLGGLGGDVELVVGSVTNITSGGSSVPNSYGSGDGYGAIGPTITYSNGLGLAVQIDTWGGNGGADSEGASQSPAKPMNDPINHAPWGVTEYCTCCGGPGAGATPVYWDVDSSNIGGSSDNSVYSQNGLYSGGGAGKSPGVINTVGKGGYATLFVYSS